MGKIIGFLVVLCGVWIAVASLPPSDPSAQLGSIVKIATQPGAPASSGTDAPPSSSSVAASGAFAPVTVPAPVEIGTGKRRTGANIPLSAILQANTGSPNTGVEDRPVNPPKHITPAGKAPPPAGEKRTREARTTSGSQPVVSAIVTRPSGARPLDERSRRELARDLQRELSRVGCYKGAIDGDWGEQSRDAMRSFTRQVNAALPVDDPDFVLLALVEKTTGKVCGGACPANETPGASGACTKKVMLAADRPRAIGKSATGAASAAAPQILTQLAPRQSDARTAQGAASGPANAASPSAYTKPAGAGPAQPGATGATKRDAAKAPDTSAASAAPTSPLDKLRAAAREASSAGKQDVPLAEPARPALAPPRLISSLRGEADAAKRRDQAARQNAGNPAQAAASAPASGATTFRPASASVTAGLPGAAPAALAQPAGSAPVTPTNAATPEPAGQGSTTRNGATQPQAERPVRVAQRYAPPSYLGRVSAPSASNYRRRAAFRPDAFWAKQQRDGQ